MTTICTGPLTAFRRQVASENFTQATGDLFDNPKPVPKRTHPDWIDRQQRRKLRRQLLQALQPCCEYCGVRLTMETLTIDHRTPRSAGGSNTFDNIAPACRACNMVKADRTPEQWAADILRGATPRRP